MKVSPAMRGRCKSYLATALVLALLCVTVSADYSADYSIANAAEDNSDANILLDSEQKNNASKYAHCENFRDCLGLDKVDCELNQVENKTFCKCDNESMWYSPELRRCVAPCKSDADCGASDNAVHCTLDPERKESFCKCDNDNMWYWHETGKCLECDCGVNGNCSYRPGPLKICSCIKGYFQKNGTCEVCDCGPNEHLCVFTIEGEKFCICNDRYKPNGKGGNCEACYCGENGSCSFENGKKVCYCKEKEEEFEGVCKSCDCGLSHDCKFNSTGGEVCEKCSYGAALRFGKCASCQACDNKTKYVKCEFDEKGDRICDCPMDKANDKGLCRDCACGIQSDGCDFKDSAKHCRCYTIYSEEEGQCTAGYLLRTIGIVVGVLAGSAIAGAVIFYLYKKHKRTSGHTH